MSGNTPGWKREWMSWKSRLNVPPVTLRFDRLTSRFESVVVVPAMVVPIGLLGSRKGTGVSVWSKVCLMVSVGSKTARATSMLVLEIAGS